LLTPPARSLLESSMVLQLMVQYPALVLLGAMVVWTTPRRRALGRGVDALLRGGAAGLAVAAILLMLWMLPRLVDAAVLDFRVETLREDVVRVLRRPPAGEEARRTAYERYLEGCRLDEDEATVERAEEAYVEALRLDPSLANALTNLGNIHYRRHDLEQAERLYRHALAVDPEQPEAHYNLGFLRLEEGEAEQARRQFEAALEVDPAFADAHFNLGLTLELLGDTGEAQTHFRIYLELCPDSEWSAEARRHLGR